MAKQTNEAADAANQLAVIGEKGKGGLSPASVGTMLNNLEANDANEITGVYHEWEQGAEDRVMFVEMTKMKALEGSKGADDSGMVDAVRIITDEGKYAINADAVFVSTCRTLTQPTPLAVTFLEMKGEKGRQYRQLKIVQLTPKK